MCELYLYNNEIYCISLDGINNPLLLSRIKNILTRLGREDLSYTIAKDANLIFSDDSSYIDKYRASSKYIIAVGKISSIANNVFCINNDAHLKSNINSALNFLKKQNLAASISDNSYSFIDNISDIVFSMDKTGTITRLNTAFENILNISRDELIGSHFTKIIHTDDIDFSKDKFLELLETLNPMVFDLRVKRSDESYIALEVKSTPILHNGELVAVNGIASDISKRKSMEQAWKKSQSNYEDLLNSIQDIVIVFNLHWKCIFANQNCKQYLLSVGNTQNPEGQTIFQILPGILNTELYASLEKVMHTRSSANVVLNSKIFDGIGKWLNFGIFPSQDGLLCLIRDITGSKIIESALHDNRENLKATLMSMDDLVYVLDKNNIFVDIYVPDGSQHFLPGTDDTLGKTLDEVFPTDLATSFKKYTHTSKINKHAEDFVFFLDRFEQRKWFSSRFSARRNNDGSYLGTTIVIRDITENQKSKEDLIASENKFKTVLHQLIDGLIIFDTNGKIVGTNPALGKILQLDSDSLLGKYIWEFSDLTDMTPHDAEVFERSEIENLFYNYRARSRSIKKLFQFDLQLSDTSSKDIYLKIFVFPFETQSAFLFAAIVRDISKRVHVEKEIKALNAELETRVKERTAQLEEAFQDLRLEIVSRENIEKDLISTKENLAKALSTERELNEIKNKFITMISHQYRTPITVISSSLDLMSVYFEMGDAEKYQKHTQKIKKAINTLIQLLENVTTFQSSNDSKLTAKLVNMNLKANLTRILDEVMIYDNDSHRIIFNYDTEDAEIFSDPKLIYMIFNNLLLNSIKFSPTKTEIIITVSSDTNHFYILVEDKGIGISEQEMQVIFNPFIRSEKVSPTMGAGLGLTIVQRCLNLLNGNIKIHSEPNRFTQVHIRLNKQSHINN